MTRLHINNTGSESWFHIEFKPTKTFISLVKVENTKCQSARYKAEKSFVRIVKDAITHLLLAPSTDNYK